MWESDVETPKAVCDDSNEEVWKVSKADFEEEVVREISDPAESAAATDGGER